MDRRGQRSEDAPGEGARGPARDEGQTWGGERRHVGLKEQRTREVASDSKVTEQERGLWGPGLRSEWGIWTSSSSQNGEGM